jgi:hypothetical protein
MKPQLLEKNMLRRLHYLSEQARGKAAGTLPRIPSNNR